MPDETTELIERLRLMSNDIAVWREQMIALRSASRAPGAKTDDKLLLHVEETSGKIYEGIAEFDALLVDIDRKSHAAAAQIVEVGDALRLTLMEITELGTQLYALRSASPGPDEDKAGANMTASAAGDAPPAAPSDVVETSKSGEPH